MMILIFLYYILNLKKFNDDYSNIKSTMNEKKWRKIINDFFYYDLHEHNTFACLFKAAKIDESRSIDWTRKFFNKMKTFRSLCHIRMFAHTSFVHWKDLTFKIWPLFFIWHREKNEIIICLFVRNRFKYSPHKTHLVNWWSSSIQLVMVVFQLTLSFPVRFFSFQLKIILTFLFI